MNYDSCKMVRVESLQAVKDGEPGAFCIVTANDGDGEFKRMWIKLPFGEERGFNLDPAPESTPFVWKWNFNELKPTLWMEQGGRKHDLHLRGQWHGRIHNGRLQSLEEKPPEAATPPAVIPESKPAKKKSAVRAAVKRASRHRS